MTEQHGAKYTFYYLLSLVSLIFIGISVGLVAFGIINKSIIDPLIDNYYRNYEASLRFAISALIIATPIYYYSLFLIRRGFKKEEISLKSNIRKYLTYFIIFVSALIILGVFISVVNNFLAGGLSLRFLLQALTVFVISGVVFSYYFHDIKSEDLIKKDKTEKIFFAISLLLIIVAFVSAWFFIESPQKARDRKIDVVLLDRISVLENSVNDYYSHYNKLPDNISELKKYQARYVMNESYFINPETKEEIVYNMISESEYEFCSTFKLNSPGENFDISNSYSNRGANRDYVAGYSCLTGILWAKDDHKQVEPINDQEILLEGTNAGL